MKVIVKLKWLAFAFSILICLSSAKRKTSEKAASATHRYRLSGSLLFNVYDGLRIRALDEIGKILEDFKTKPIDELIAKAHKYLQNSEIKGSIKVQAPNGQTFTILKRSQFDSFAFFEPRFFLFEFMHTNLVKEITISCDLVEDDDTAPICQGSKSYRVSRDRSASIDMQLDRVGIIKSFIKRLGYDKLYTPNGAQDIDQVIDAIDAFINANTTLLPYYTGLLKDTSREMCTLNGTDKHIDQVNDAIDALVTVLPYYIGLLKNVSGVFLVGLSLEEVDDSRRPGDYKRVDDSWEARVPDESGGNELFGQLYVLPQAEIFKPCDLLSSILQCPDRIKDFELPDIQGPAFPLFDNSRIKLSSGNEYELPNNAKNPISVFYKNQKQHSYVIFSNMWEWDGDAYYDDCIAKGNALGFDTVDFNTSESQNLTQCSWNQDNTILLSKSGDVEDQESGLVEYQLKGSFDFVCQTDPPGSEYEPYGNFSISIGARPINQKYMVWNPQTGEEYIAVKIGRHYNQPFMVRFRESKSFMDTATPITLHGYVYESDNTSSDDVIGNYDGNTYKPNDLAKNYKTMQFRGEDRNDVVTITLYLSPVKFSLFDYVLTGTIHYFCTSDGLSAICELYGGLSVNIGNKIENRNIQLFKLKNRVDKVEDVMYSKEFSHNFKETEDFMTTGKITIFGKIMEHDDSSDDDVIGNFNGRSYDTSILANTHREQFDGEDGYVVIDLKISKTTRSSSGCRG